jgi:hypothetical protein
MKGSQNKNKLQSFSIASFPLHLHISDDAGNVAAVTAAAAAAVVIF